jgi:Flp pilus assembly protein TadG
MMRKKMMLRRYIRDDSGMAAVESALLFPILVMMLVSMVDIGNGVLANQKLIAAAQITADLVTREANPTLDQRSDAIVAGQIAMSPYTLDSYAYNVVSLMFAEDGSPEIVWQDSSGLILDQGLVDDTTDLGNPGEGVVMVQVTYTFNPFFTGFVLGPIHMQEVAYVRGRKSAVVGLPLEDEEA